MFVISLALLPLLVTKVTDFLRYLTSIGTPTGKNGVISQATAWAGGIGVAFLAASSTYVNNLTPIEGHNLGSFNGPALVFYGLLLGSGASVLNDLKSAIGKGENVPRLTETGGPVDLPPHGD